MIATTSNNERPIVINGNCEIKKELERSTSVKSSRNRVRSRSSKTTNKCVRFANASSNDIHEIDFVSKNFAKMVWYSTTELRAIKAENFRFASNYCAYIEKKMAGGGSSRSISSITTSISISSMAIARQHAESKLNGTSRGIEYLIDEEVNRLRTIIKQKSISSVLSEQCRQNEVSWVIDPYLIADIYGNNGANKAKATAHQKGLKDESFAIHLSTLSRRNKAREKIVKTTVKLKGLFFPRKNGNVSCAAA